jgi:hypothetical protein
MSRCDILAFRLSDERPDQFGHASNSAWNAPGEAIHFVSALHRMPGEFVLPHAYSQEPNPDECPSRDLTTTNGLAPIKSIVAVSTEKARNAARWSWARNSRCDRFSITKQSRMFDKSVV